VYVRPDRQILMWSDTWPTDVRSLAADFTDNTTHTIQVSIGSMDVKANHCVKQENKLYTVLREDLRNETQVKGVVYFVSTNL